MAVYETIAYAVRARLLAVSEVTDLTSRIYPFAAPQFPVQPFILYSTSADLPYDDIEGRAGLFRANLELLAVSDAHEAAWELSEAIRIALQGYHGTYLGVRIRGIQLESRMDGFQEEISEFTVLSKYKIWHDEEIVPS